MIPKSVLAHLVEKQNKAQEERLPGLTRHLLHEIPYLSDRALLLGGLRGAGRSTLLWQLRRSEYAQAWYINLEDPRLAGFDAGDFEKLTRLIAESGRGVVLFDKIDRAEGVVTVCLRIAGWRHQSDRHGLFRHVAAAPTGPVPASTWNPRGLLQSPQRGAPIFSGPPPARRDVRERCNEPSPPRPAARCTDTLPLSLPKPDWL